MMETIFHEKQDGSLCAQHCLNSLLQGPYFTPVDLSTLANNLDEAERLRMAECGEESEEYRRFMEQPSGNMDDSGYFSVQVISSALEVWGLELVPYSSTDDRVKNVFSEPCRMQAFICNYKDHWFTIRKLGVQWFNLNSLLKKPQLISDTYLSLFLAQLKNDGYSIFVVFGSLPDCTADQVLKANPVINTAQGTGSCNQLQNANNDEDDEVLQAALLMSMHDSEAGKSPFRQQEQQQLQSVNVVEEDDEELEKAIRISLQNDEELQPVQNEVDDDDEATLKQAIQMSLQY